MSIFTKIRLKKPNRSTFNLSHDRKQSFRMGKLVPSLVLETMPGDKFTLGSENMYRLAPLVSPVMHSMQAETHYFFCPNRILCDDWEDFITGNAPAEHPYITGLDSFDSGSLADYLGYNGGTSIAANIKCNAYPIAAYAKIYDEWYRDQNTQETQFPEGGLVPGNNNLALSNLLSDPPLARSWQHDYFTSCLPFSQKGPDVRLPIFNDGDGEVKLNLDNTGTAPIMRDATDFTTPAASAESIETGLGGQMVINDDPFAIDPNTTLHIPEEDAGTIRSFRRAFRLQEFYERLARTGSRYTEFLHATFGARNGDARLQRPELIGGIKQNVTISEVLSTAQTIDQGDNSIPLGQMAGHGISVGGGQSFRYTAKEHGFIIAITSIRPTTAYFQGIHPSLTRSDMFDYPFPDFAHIGEQEVKVKELYLGVSTDATTTEEDLDEVFGYIPRYSEMRYMNGSVHGDFKDTLDFWHMARKFGEKPTLSSDFLRSDSATDRIYAVQTPGIHQIYAHHFNNVRVSRVLPKYADPTL